MKILDLEAALLAKGCNKNMFAVGSRGMASDAYCIVNRNQSWQIFYTERGKDREPIFSSASESEACNFFYNHILSQQHWHLIGHFSEETEAIKLEIYIQSIGVKPVRNDAGPFIGTQDYNYRVFVMGSDIFPVLNAIPDLPIIKDPKSPKGFLSVLKLGCSYFTSLRSLSQAKHE